MTRWFSDASALTRYGVPTVNYGTSTGLMDTARGENLAIDGLAQTAEVYARAALRICGQDGETHVKLVTFEHAETGLAVGHVEGDEIALLEVPTMREYFERGGAEESGRRVRARATRTCARRSCPRSSSTRRATSASTRKRASRSTGTTRSRPGSSSSRTSTR